MALERAAAGRDAALHGSSVPDARHRADLGPRGLAQSSLSGAIQDSPARRLSLRLWLGLRRWLRLSRWLGPSGRIQLRGRLGAAIAPIVFQILELLERLFRWLAVVDQILAPLQIRVADECVRVVGFRESVVERQQACA